MEHVLQDVVVPHEFTEQLPVELNLGTQQRPAGAGNETLGEAPPGAARRPAVRSRRWPSSNRTEPVGMLDETSAVPPRLASAADGRETRAQPNVPNPCDAEAGPDLSDDVLGSADD